MILTTTKGQKDLPRYFGPVFDVVCNLRRGRMDFVLEDGRIFRAEGEGAGYQAVLEVHHPEVFTRLIREGDLGFSEAYLDGWWTTPDLQAFMDFVHDQNDTVSDNFVGYALIRAWENLRFWLQSNTKKQARKNISYHYDLGNDFYRLWLDDTMTYSSALFKTGQESLEKAQTQKYEAMVDQMGVKEGDHVLEIGCGWGGFAEYAAGTRGLNVTCLTISQEQYKYAVDRIEKAGLSDKVTFKLQDYRDETGRYDGIASIEMFEAVGEKYWPTYFDKVRECLKPGAQATLQVITLADKRWEAYRKGVDFIQKYIFPGGMLPSPTILREQAKSGGLEVVGSMEFGESYSQTLRRWHETFNEKWDQIAAMGFDARFKRMWDFYLTTCAGTFHAGNCDVTQITVRRPA